MFLAGLACAMFGSTVLPAEMGAWVANNRTTLIGVAFFGNMVASQLMQTGAFEVSLDGKGLFSKLESGRLPEVMELVQLIRAHVADPTAAIE